MPGGGLDCRLHFVVGKGGVGKTTVAAALALCTARLGRRTLAVEMDMTGRLPAVLGLSGTSVVPRQVSANLAVVSIDGRAALEEYLGLIVPVKRLLHTVFSSRVYQYFVAAAPGLKELMTVGKIWYEVTRAEGGRPAWDTVVVDAPATGHSLQYLRMPQAAHETFGAGLVQREAAKIVELLRDPTVTGVHVVTLAEEMPVAETLETCEQLRAQLDLPLGWIVANRLHWRRFDPETLAALAAASVREPDGPLLASVADRATEEAGWTAINHVNLERLRAGVGGAPIIELPYLFAEEFGADELGSLSGIIEATVAPAGGGAS
jgi:anion-transporting  ArsA/GET3 family ATPase